MPSPDPTRWASLPYADREAWNDFMGEHGRVHTALFTQIVGILGAPAYAAYPLTDGIGQPWLMANDQEHRNICNALGIPGPPDLASVDLRQEEQFQEWLLVHAEEHARIAAASGLL